MGGIYWILISVLVVSTIIVALPFVILYVKSNKKGIAKLSNCAISHELEFGGAYVKISIDDFNKLGFDFGDSVNISFSNGYNYYDIPYYNGYYSDTGSTQLLGYPGSEYVKVAISNGDDLWDIADLDTKTLDGEQNMLWDIAKLSDDTTVTITLAKKGKYLDIQNARDIHYFDEREQYTTDEVFANFRSMKGGKLRENYFYRSASPCDNQHCRASYVDELIKKAGIKFVINLADDEQKIQSYIKKSDYNSPYFSTLYDANNTANDCVEPLAFTMNYKSQSFKKQTVKAMIAILEHEGPFLVHCTEGKDRTGFICLVIEALAECSYNEIVSDYMITYANYYSITKELDENKYNIIVNNVLSPMIKSIIQKRHIDIKKTNLADCVKKFLIKNGMTAEQIKKLQAKLIGETNKKD